VLRVALLVLATVLLFAANVGTWFRSTVLDSSEFASTVDDVLSKPEATDRVSDVLATQALASDELQVKIEALLPSEGPFVSALLENELHTLVARLIERILSLDALQNVVEQAIERMHATLLSFLKDERVATLEDGRLVLDLNGVLTELFTRLGLAVPERLQAEGSGEVVLMEDASQLDKLSAFVKGIDELVPVLLVLAIVAGLAYVWLAPDRVRAARLCGYAIVVAGLASLLVWRLADRAFETLLSERPLAVMLLDGLTSDLRSQSIGLMVFGAAVAVAADRRVMRLVADAGGRGNRELADFGYGRAFLVSAALLVLILLLV
jgi:hypothetical protein